MSKSQPPRQLLVVDDHDDTRDVTARVLESRGHLVMTAANVATALALAERFRFDLLIADVELPDGSGLDLLAQMRQARPIVGIVVSGHGRSSDVASALAAGFSHHFLKPINVGNVLQTIDELLSQSPPPPEPSAIAVDCINDQSFLQLLGALPAKELRRLRTLLAHRTDEAAAAMLRVLDGGSAPPAVTPPGS